MINQSVFIPNVTAEDIYDVLLDSNKHSKLTGDRAKIDAKVGGKFTTFSGYSEGKNLELVPGKLIKQTWRANDWDDNVFSTITFRLKNTDEGAQIDFLQENLPEGTKAEFEVGWQDNYWVPMQKYFSD